MSYKSKEIGELANYIVKELKIHNDRMLFTKLKLKEEDKDIRFRMKQLLIPNREE